MDIINIEILDDGKVSVKTDNISQANHLNADELLEEIESMLGGESKREARKHPHWNKYTVQRGGKIIKKAKQGGKHETLDSI